MQRDSLSKSLEGSVGELLIAHGHAFERLYTDFLYHTICFGTITDFEKPRYVSKEVLAYKYGHPYKNITHSIPSKMIDVLEPPNPIVHREPVDVANRPSVEELLRDMGFNGKFHFDTGECKIPVNPTTGVDPEYYEEVPGFELEYLARIHKEERRIQKIWERKK